jgi:hypothetical protein
VATVRFSIAPGFVDAQITQAVGAATVTTNVELTVDLGNTMDGATRVISREELVHTLKRLHDYIVQGGTNRTGWPPQ